jgi:cytochrome c oxidase assembly factor CtaG
MFVPRGRDNNEHTNFTMLLKFTIIIIIIIISNIDYYYSKVITPIKRQLGYVISNHNKVCFFVAVLLHLLIAAYS